jgi:hypothetical protein
VALIVFAAMAIPIRWRRFAPEPVLPFLQDGTARTAYVSDVYETCMQKQQTLPENVELSARELSAYCLYNGRALADVINSNGYEAMVEGVEHAPASIVKKAEMANTICALTVLTSRQNTEHERNVVAMSNECRKAYHPEDIDFAAAVGTRKVLWLFGTAGFGERCQRVTNFSRRRGRRNAAQG